jgi:hypothetical protein
MMMMRVTQYSYCFGLRPTHTEIYASKFSRCPRLNVRVEVPTSDQEEENKQKTFHQKVGGVYR